MTKFKVGDKVRVYGWMVPCAITRMNGPYLTGVEGVKAIVETAGPFTLEVRTGGDYGYRFTVHHRQCRKIKVLGPKRVCVTVFKNEAGVTEYATTYANLTKEGTYMFVPAKRK